jgi:hypothetical protein
VLGARKGFQFFVFISDLRDSIEIHHYSFSLQSLYLGSVRGGAKVKQTLRSLPISDYVRESFGGKEAV